MLPYNEVGFSVELDNIGGAILEDPFFLVLLFHIDFGATKGTGVPINTLLGKKLASAISAMEAGVLFVLLLLFSDRDGSLARGAACFGSFRLIVYHIVAAFGAFHGGHALGANINHVSTRAGYLFFREEARIGFDVFPALGTCDDEFFLGHESLLHVF